jgi:hypothetical protein
MADPTVSASSPTPPAAAQNTVISEDEKRYRKAGFTRNRAEANYRQAVKDHGPDSAEAKEAHQRLEEAQKVVEDIQKEWKQPKKPTKPSPKPAPKPPEKKDPPKPQSLPNSERAEIKGEYLIETYHEERIMKIIDLKKLLKDNKKLEEIIKRFLKDHKKLQQISPPPNGEMLFRSAEFFRVPTKI